MMLVSRFTNALQESGLTCSSVSREKDMGVCAIDEARRGGGCFSNLY